MRHGPSAVGDRPAQHLLVSAVPDVKAVKVHIGGRVQGVFFRASAQERAHDLSITGWVRNQVGGQVEVFAQGEADLLEVFLAWLREGPTMAEVVEFHLLPARVDPRFASFEIR